MHSKFLAIKNRDKTSIFIVNDAIQHDAGWIHYSGKYSGYTSSVLFFPHLLMHCYESVRVHGFHLSAQSSFVLLNVIIS